MADVIFSPVGRFTTVRDPYVQDDYVQKLFTKVTLPSEARSRYKSFLVDQPLLPLLLTALAEDAAAQEKVEVVDCGVYMGNFTIAVDIQAEAAEVTVALSAYEANPVLQTPIAANLAMYGVIARLEGKGIGGAHEMLEFAAPQDALIGGTLYDIAGKTSNPERHVTLTPVPVIPLSAALSPEPAPGLVKLDIEGNEVDAFRSIARDPARLNNIFCVEYAPFQGHHSVAGQSYNDFLLDHFAVFDINNWLWWPYAHRLATPEALSRVMQDHPSRPVNTDLLLVPKAMELLIAEIAARGDGSG